MRSGTVAVVLLVGVVGLGCGRPPEPGAAGAAVRGTAKLSWTSGWDDAMARAKRDDRVVMASFYADWCIWCKRLDSTTLADADVVALLASRAVAVRVDGEREGRVLAGRFRVDGYPTVVFLSADGQELGRVSGYLEPADFLETVRPWLG